MALMSDAATIGALVPIGMVMVGYLLAMCLLAVVVYPMRRRMFLLAESILDEKHWNKADRDSINHLMDTALSFRMSLLLPVGVVGVMVDTVLQRECGDDDRYRDRLMEDPRFHGILWRYCASILAVNPLAAAVTLPLMAVGLIVEAFAGGHRMRDMVEEPVLRASAAMS